MVFLFKICNQFARCLPWTQNRRTSMVLRSFLIWSLFFTSHIICLFFILQHLSIKHYYVRWIQICLKQVKELLLEDIWNISSTIIVTKLDFCHLFLFLLLDFFPLDSIFIGQVWLLVIWLSHWFVNNKLSNLFWVFQNIYQELF
jgi:hypothetical protein